MWNAKTRGRKERGVERKDAGAQREVWNAKVALAEVMGGTPAPPPPSFLRGLLSFLRVPPVIPARGLPSFPRAACRHSCARPAVIPA